MNVIERFVYIAEYLKRRVVPLPYDAATHTAEVYYAVQYLSRIDQHLSELNMHPLRILDAGCGSGRFLIPLAKNGHRMTGIDYHRHSVRLVRKKSSALGKEVDIHDGDLNSVVATFPNGIFDAILCLEVLLTSRNRRQATANLYRLLKSGGLLFITHRPRSYYLWKSLKNKNFDDALFIHNHCQGRLKKRLSSHFYNWQSLQEIENLYSSLGAKILELSSIGPCSGFAVDPLTDICDPGELDEIQRKQLAALESEVSREMLALSRYILAVSQKPA